MKGAQTKMQSDLQRLGHRLRLGMAQLYPATEKELRIVREAIARQWEHKQRQGQRQAKAKATVRSQAKSVKRAPGTAPAPRRQPSQDYGHSH